MERGAQRPRERRRGDGGREELESLAAFVKSFRPRLRGGGEGQEGAPREPRREREVRVVRRGRAARGEHGARGARDARGHRGGSRACFSGHRKTLPIASGRELGEEHADPPQETRSDRPQEQTAVVQVQVRRAVHARARQRPRGVHRRVVVALAARAFRGGQSLARARQRRVRPQTPGREERRQRRARRHRRLAAVHRQELLGVGERGARARGRHRRVEIRHRQGPGVVCRRRHAEDRRAQRRDVRLVHVAPRGVLEPPRLARRGRVLPAGRARVVRLRVRGGRDASPPRHERRLRAPGIAVAVRAPGAHAVVRGEQERRASVVLRCPEPSLERGDQTPHAVVDYLDVFRVRVTEGLVRVARAVQSQQMQQEDDAFAFQRLALGVARRSVGFVLRGDMPVENLDRPVEHPLVQRGVVVGRREVLQLLGVHAVPHVLDAFREQRHHGGRTDRPRRGGLVQQVVELHGVGLPSLRDGARILVKASQERDVPGARFRGRPGVADAPAAAGFRHTVQKRRAGNARGVRVVFGGVLQLKQPVRAQSVRHDHDEPRRGRGEIGGGRLHAVHERRNEVHVEHGVDEQRVQRDAENRQAGLRGHHRDRSPRSPRAPDRMRMTS